MSEYLIQSETLTGIADAIREKKGTSDPILVSNFAAEIESIQAGGGENKFALFMGVQDVTLRPYSITLADWGDYPPDSIYQLFGGKLGLVSIVIPKTVKSNDYAFQGNYNLERVTFEEGSQVTTIGYSTFSGCKKLTNIINIPTAITRINDSAFYNCNVLEGDFTFKLTSLARQAFNGCYKINSLDFSQSTFTTLNDQVMYGCRSLTSLTLPSSLTTINSSSLYNIGLNDFTIPENVTTIKASAFGNSYFETFTFNNALTTAENACLQNCKRLHTVLNLENTQLTTLPNFTFQTCYYLKNITLPNTLTTIGNSVFYECYSLSELTIPASVTTIGSTAFNCGSSTTTRSVQMYSNKEMFIEGTNTSTTISNLTKTTFTFLSTTPPSIQSGTFTNSYVEKIIVPAGCGEAYRTATNWTTVADKIEEATA